MGALIFFVGTTVGGAIGWYIGSFVGFWTAFVLSCVGTGVGLYVARQAASRYLVLVAAAFLLVAPRAQAQTQTPESLQAAKELVQVMHLDKTLHDQISAAFDRQVQYNPAMAPYRAAMQQFLDKYLSWDAIGPQVTAMYAQTFSAGELKDLIAFYRTPTGQKLAAQGGVLAAKSEDISMQVVQQHQADLADLIRKQQTGDTTSKGARPSP